MQRRAEALPRTYSGRRRFVLVLFILAAAALVVRAVERQIFETDFLKSEGADRYLDEVVVAAHRGAITDRHGVVLAMSAPVDSIAANPRLLRPDHERLHVLARALEMDLDDLRHRLARYAHRHFIYLKRRLPPARAKRVMEMARAQGIPGLQVRREYRRYYPDGEIFAHVVGFTDVDEKGQEGVELAFEQDLAGRPGLKRVLRDGRGQVVADVESLRMPRPGRNLALSLDQRLQYIAYRELKAAVKRHRARAGSVVVLDPRTGEVLAMVNQPGYNPNGDRSSRGGRLLNRAVTQVFEPGSTMKPFVVAAALERGVVGPSARIDTGKGVLRVGRDQVKDHHPLGVVDLRTLLQKSSNVGAAKLALALPREELYDTFRKLGFGGRTGITYPGEVSGRLRPARQWARIEQATLSFGYGLSVTALQLAQAYAVLAADGVRRPPTLLRRTQAPEGERVFSSRTARIVRRLMEAVVSQGGTGTEAAVPGYRVAGKTGTVKKAGKGGYQDGRYVALFAGMVPADAPRLVAVVMIDEPRGKAYYGGQVAAPVFARIMDDALRLLNVPPDEPGPGRGVRLVSLEKER